MKMKGLRKALKNDILKSNSCFRMIKDHEVKDLEKEEQTIIFKGSVDHE